ncbi:MAG: COX15/CtaA family protein [Dehalococcoidia bacterium]|nr:COX15/CtaA family protein [Dehalococcoidia bacterium]
MKYLNAYSFSIFVIIYTLFNIALGAMVRATGSGAGCGVSWPSCNGQIVISGTSHHELIEYSHRISSGIDLLLVAILLFVVLKNFDSHLPKLLAFLSFCFILLEAGIGALIVLFQWVADDASLGRSIIVPFHLINTFFLMFFLVATSWSLLQRPSISLNYALINQKYWKKFLFGIALFFLLSISGATTALADTLFSVGDLKSEFLMDISSRAHLLTRIRILHPLIAIFTLVWLIIYSQKIAAINNVLILRRLSFMILVLFLIELLVGLLNVIFLTPLSLQIIHLLLAHFIWIVLVLFFLEGLKNFQYK